jgi:protein-arginine kinase activator protein McsA
MLCDICQSRNATLHFTTIEPGERRTKRDVCSVCLPPTLSEKEREEMFQKLLAEKRNQSAAPVKNDGPA